MTTMPISVPQPPMRRTSIGLRLILAFASIAGLTAIAGGASSLLSLQGSAIVDSLGSKTLPTVAASLSFSQRSAVLAAEAPALATQKDAAALNEQAARLAARLDDQKKRLSELRQMVDDPALLDSVESLRNELGDKITQLKGLTAERIALQATLDKHAADAFAAYQDLMDFVRPLQEATQTEVDGVLSDLKNRDKLADAPANGTRLADVDMPALRTSTDVQANGNLAFGMLLAAATARNEDALADARTQYDWAELHLGQAVKAMGTGPDAARITKLSEALLSAGAGPDGVFAVKRHLFEVDAASVALLPVMLEKSSALSTEVERVADAQQASAANAVVRSGEVTRQSLIVNGVLSGVVLLAAVLIGWFYVHRIVVRRLNALARTMGRLVEGERHVEVDTSGRDEISQMAAAVQVFKTTMIRGDELTAEAARSSEEREATRRQADAERTEAAARQAAVVEGLAGGLARLAKGDLTCLLERPFSSEYESLRRDFNAAAAQLKSVMEQIVVNADSLRTGTGEISSATDDLSRRTEQQAASLEETAAALGEITATVRKTSEGATHARDVAGVAKADAERSGEVVRQAVDAMSGIEASAGQINDIIGVIDEIAFQTNLLALNAGVEAARAGEAGRGFAVVASEVRALAQRSAEAAKEIKTLIRASSAQVEQGVDLVGQTGRALEHILTQVVELSQIVSDIAASAKDQTTGLEQINGAVNQMDQVTQQNAAMVEQTTAASHSLVRDTDRLAGLIGQFDVGRGRTEAGRATIGATTGGGSSRPAGPGTVVAMKTVRTGGAPLKQQATAAATDWEEF